MTDETTTETQRLIHDLRVHQIELEMQNQDLRETQAALDTARAEYFDLYDLAPVGYCTLGHASIIERANLTLATLLGAPRASLIGARFTRFILAEDQDLFYLNRKRLAEVGETMECDVRMKTSSGAFVWVHLSALAAPDHEGRPLVRLTVADIGERKQAEVELRQSLREKERLMKEIHHRVKNNLQVITSLLRLESSRARETGTKDVLTEMQARIRSMALLHETLYRSGNFAGVELSEYLRQLANQLLRSQDTAPGRVHLAFSLSPVTLPAEHAIPCGLIVNELLTNSLKHGFTQDQGGEVRLSLEREVDGRIRVCVSDTGVGLPEDFESRRGSSLGLQLVNDLARQLGGSLEIGPPPKAMFTVVFRGVEPEAVVTST